MNFGFLLGALRRPGIVFATLAGAAGPAVAAPGATENSSLPMLAMIVAVPLLAGFIAWAVFAKKRESKPDPAAFMTLDQITRLQSPDGESTLMKVARPKGEADAPRVEKKHGATRTGSPSDAYMSELEKRFPRIVEKLEMMWSAPECVDYLQTLTIDDRGDREGFSKEVAADIMMLYGVKVKEQTGQWF